MVTQKKSSCQDGDPEQPGQGPGGEQDEAAEQARSQVMMMFFLLLLSLLGLIYLWDFLLCLLK